MNPIQISIGIILIIILLSGLWGLTRTIKECETDEDCPQPRCIGMKAICDNGLCKTVDFEGKLTRCIETDEYFCALNSDCVPATCCHPDACINKNYQPDCKGIVCTMECRSNTMDCGQGRCVCLDNTCQVEWL